MYYKATPENFRVLDYSVLTVMVLASVSATFKTHRNVYFQWVQFIIYKLYLNKNY